MFVAAGMLMWGVERLFISRSRQTTNLSSQVNPTDLQDVVGNLLAQNKVNYAQLSETQQQQYTQYALHILKQEGQLTHYTDSMELYVHPQVLGETLASQGTLSHIQDAIRHQKTQPNPQAMQQMQSRVNRMQRQVNHQLLFNALQTSQITTQEEAKNYQHSSQQTRKFSWAKVPMVPTNTSQVPEPADVDIQKYYDQNAFSTQELAAVNYIHFPASQFKAKNPSSTELASFYQDHVERFDLPKQLHFKRFSLVPETMANAHKVSTKQVLSSWGGKEAPKLKQEWLYYLDTETVAFSEKTLPTAELTELKPNQYLIYPDDSGHVYLYKFTHVTSAKSCTLATCSQDIRSAWIAHQTQENREQLASKIQDDILYSPSNLSKLATKYDTSVHTTPAFTEDKGIGIAESANFRKHAFTPTLHESKQIADPIVLEDGSLVVMTSKAFTPARKQDLEKVKPAIIQDLKTQQAAKERQSQLEQSLSELRNSQDIHAFTSKWETHLENSQHINMQNVQTLPNPVARMGFSLATDALGWQKAIMLPDYASQSWLIFSLQDVKFSTLDGDDVSEYLPGLHQLEVAQLLERIQ